MKSFKSINYEVDGKEITVYFDENDNAYLTQKEICKLFGKTQSTIAHHTNETLKQNEYMQNVHKLNEYVKKIDNLNEYIQNFDKLTPKIDRIGPDGKTYSVTCYHLDLVIQIGYRIRSDNALKLKELIDNKYEIIDPNLDKVIIYNNGEISVDVRLSVEENTVWIDISRIAAILNREKSVIYKHIKAIFEDGELDEKSNLHFLPLANSDKPVAFYNLDVFISVGYRANSPQAIAFRRWATQVLKDYIIKGYCLNNNLLTISEKNYYELRKDVDDIKIDVNQMKEKLEETMPKQRIFSNGQFFDAYDYLCEMVYKANNELIIIDPYFDEKGLKILQKSKSGVKKFIYISSFSKLNEQDVEEFKKQYGDLYLYKDDSFHDRFVIIDRKYGYHLGASFNYAGKKTFEVDPIIEDCILSLLLNKLQK